jgi:hypothetical protein
VADRPAALERSALLSTAAPASSRHIARQGQKDKKESKGNSKNGKGKKH